MLDNKTYDLMMQIVQESQSLHHIKEYYQLDAAGDKECNEVWNDLIRDKESYITRLVNLLKSHL